jgi:hypothetical protein
VAAAPYLHPQLSAIDAKLSPAAEPSPNKPTSIVVSFVVPGADHGRRRTATKDEVVAELDLREEQPMLTARFLSFLRGEEWR